MRVVYQRGLLCGWGRVCAKLLLCVQNLVANIPAAVAVAAASADIVVVAVSVASVVAAAFGNVEISCFRQAQPLRRIPANPTKLPDKLRESVQRQREHWDQVAIGTLRVVREQLSERAREIERELARLNFKCIAWKLDIAMSAATWREYCCFFWLVSYFLQLCCWVLQLKLCLLHEEVIWAYVCMCSCCFYFIFCCCLWVFFVLCLHSHLASLSLALFCIS